MKLANKILLITGDTSGVGLEAVKRWCMELWLLKTAFGLPEIGNPDAVKAIEEEEIASNCGSDQAKECLPNGDYSSRAGGASLRTNRRYAA
jgi:NAD(P)-dependent dehydrogenase (short-subunit alcohol dehydrogenase family)